MKITEALLAEHVVFHTLFDHLESTLPRLRSIGEIRALARVLEALLEKHSAAEDNLLLAPMDHYIEQLGQKESFEEEHEEIDSNLHEALKARQPAKARRHLLAAVSASRRHFDKEERLLFPMAEKVLKARTLNELGAAWETQRQAH